MPRALQIVVTDNFAGAERYVAGLSRGLATAGWDVTLVGGREAPMRAEAGERVTWRPGSSLLAALRSVRAAGRFDVCHAHMTYAEAVAVAARRTHGAPVVATRHFAAPRGSSLPGWLLSGWVARGLASEIAISAFVAGRLERPPTAVVHNGVPDAPSLWRQESRTVLVLQRLAPEKDTATALTAWARSGLAERGWCLRVVGDGPARTELEHRVQQDGVRGVTFVGWVPDVAGELRQAGILLAPAPAEPFGLSVVEAMAAGVPVVAAAGGGHLETVAAAEVETLFPPGDAEAAGRILQRLADDDVLRRTQGERGRAVQRARFTLPGQVAAVTAEYERMLSGAPLPAPASAS